MQSIRNKNMTKINPFEVLEREFPELNEWLKSLCRLNLNMEDVAKIDYKEKNINISIYTKENKYCIVARYPEETADGINYLGCTVTSRKPRAGEDWNRGNDLPDGKYNKETWDKIKDAILAYELVKVSKV